MIEIKLSKDLHDFYALFYLSELTQWVLNEVKVALAEKLPHLDGVLMVRDQNTGKYSCLLICEGKTQEKIQTLLQDPPESLGKKYDSYIVHEEPECVKEVEPPHLNPAECDKAPEHSPEDAEWLKEREERLKEILEKDFGKEEEELDCPTGETEPLDKKVRLLEKLVEKELEAKMMRKRGGEGICFNNVSRMSKFHDDYDDYVDG